VPVCVHGWAAWNRGLGGEGKGFRWNRGLGRVVRGLGGIEGWGGGEPLRWNKGLGGWVRGRLQRRRV
jgi:hypothetical protein